MYYKNIRDQTVGFIPEGGGEREADILALPFPPS